MLWSGSLALLLFAIIEAPARGWRSPAVIAALLACATLMALFAREERRAREPMLAPSLARDPGMQAGAVTVIGMFFALFGAQFTLTQWIQGPRRGSALVAGLCFLPMALATMTAATRNPSLVRRLGRRAVVGCGLATMAAALVLVGWAVSANQLFAVVGAMAVLGAGQGRRFPPEWS